ncbi:MAG: DUF11 domain-containing protein, partial [Clostridia bacterium]|nr:DUF11 domain-containing protein [Clostridia bacterium]
LAITPAAVTLTSGSKSREYNGSALTNDEVEGKNENGLTVETGWVGSEGATYEFSGTITDKGTVKNAFSYNLKEGTIASNYSITKTEGDLTITAITDKVTVTITENSGSEKYDGNEKTVTGYTVTKISNTLYTEADFEFKGDATVKGTDAGSYPMELKPADFTNISTNFTNVEFKIVDGTLEISKRTVIMTSATDTKVYDSTPLTNDEVKETGDGFVDGEGADYDVTGSQTLVGTSDNTFTYELKEGTKASNYEIKTVLGKLTVTDEDVPDNLVVKKTADETLYQLGDEVSFDIWVKNIYDDTVTIKLTEIPGVTLAKDTFEGVKPGEEITTTATYTITEADILARGFTNTVTAKVVEKEWTADASVNVEEPHTELVVTKKTTSNPANGEAYVLGETITYEISVENKGNITISDITVADEKTGDEWTITELKPGASEVFKPSYVVTEEDVLAGSVKNFVTAKGTSEDPDNPEPDGGDDVEDPTEDPNGHLTVTKKTTSTPADGKAYVLNEKITYEINVKNDGNLTLTNVTVTDELTGDEWTIATMKPGDEQTYEAEYTVTEADILAGSVKNFVTAKGKSEDPDNPEPDDDADVEDPTEDPNGHITIEKVTTSKSANPKGYVEGETITYKITVKNDGNLTIKDVTVTDALTGDEWKVEGDMVPGAVKEYETSYTVTAEDVQAGEVLNVATATGKSPDPKNPDVPVTPGEDPEPTTEDKYTLTIEYVYQNGRTAAETYTEVLHAGDNYDVQSPYIAGYYASQQKVTGTMPARDVMVTVIYIEPRNTITIDDFVTPLGIGLGSMNAGETIE